MTKFRLITTLALAFAFLFAQVGHVAAAPSAQDTTPITGTIDTIVLETDANGVTTVVVTLTDGQSYRLSVETAADLNLLVVDSNGQPVLDPVTGLPTVDESQIGQSIEIDPTTVVPDEPDEEEAAHPIAILLGAFFGEDASVIDGYHSDGFGFGVIAQALWMSKNLSDDATMVEQILQAKKDGSGTFTLSDGTEITYTNWGQLRKALMGKKQNLGQVISGHADPDDASTQQEHGKGKGNGNGNGKGNGKGHNKP